VKSVLSDFCTDVQAMLSKGRVLFDENPNEFISKEIKILGGLTQSYVDLLTKLNVYTKVEAYSHWNAMKHDPGVPEAISNLVKAENDFDEFLKEVDQKTMQSQKNGYCNVSSVGSKFPDEAKLVTNASEKRQSLSDFLPSVGSLIVVILRHFA